MKKDKDILFMCQFFYPEYVSSATLPFDTAKRLSDDGYKVGALCGYPKEYTSEKSLPVRENKDGIEIKRLKYAQVKRVGKLGKLINYFSFAISVFFNLSYARRYKAVMVYSNPPLLPFFAAMAKKLYGCKLIFVSYDVYPEIAMAGGYTGKGGMISKGLSFVNKTTFKNADKVVAVSSDMAEFLRNNRKIEAQKVTSIPNWYKDEGEFPINCEKTAKCREELFSCEADDFVVSYFGNLGECQDEKILIDVIDRLKGEKNIKFVFAGHGTKIEKLKETVKLNSYKNVRILPFLHGEDYKNALAATNVFAVTLIDGLCGLCSPSKACCCMMIGRPVIAVMDKNSEVGSDVEDSGAGKCFANSDGERIAEFIKELRDHPDVCEKMGKCSRELFVSKYEKEICLDQYSELFKQLMTD